MRFENLFNFCPVCGSSNFVIHNVKSKKCDACGFVLYVNPSCAVACFVMNDRKELLVCKRAKDPAKATLDLPGGFVDEFESAEQALFRELKEELNGDVQSYQYLFSLPNEYLYSGFTIPTLDMIYLVRLSNDEELIAADDVESIQWVNIANIHPMEFGLKSIRQAVELFIQNYDKY